MLTDFMVCPFQELMQIKGIGKAKGCPDMLYS